MAGWPSGPSGLRRCGLITVRLLGSSAWVRIPLLSKVFDFYQQMHKTDSVISWRLAHLHSIYYDKYNDKYDKVRMGALAGLNF